MTREMIGLINMRNAQPLKEINDARPVTSIPIGGKYRLIDFTLSNMVNAGITTVGLLLPHQSRSILDHIRSGREWGLAHKGDGLFYLPEENGKESEGDIDTYYKNLTFVRRGKSKYLLLSSGNMVINIDYEEALHFHRKHNADVTLIYQKVPVATEKEGYTLTLNDKDRVLELNKPATLAEGDNKFLGCILIDCEIFQDSIEKSYAEGYHHFIGDVLARSLKRLRVFGYEFQGYAKRVHDVESYFQVNMDLLDPKTWRELLNPNPQHRIYTKINDEAPAKYMEEAKATNSLVANGCIIEGTVENSIFFRRVKVGKNAVVKNSIIMQYTEIGDDARLDHVICDKNTVIQPEATLSGTEEKPLCIGKRAVL